MTAGIDLPVIADHQEGVFGKIEPSENFSDQVIGAPGGSIPIGSLGPPSWWPA